MQALQKFDLDQIATFEVLFLVENTHPFNSAHMASVVWIGMKERHLALFPDCLVASIARNESLEVYNC